MTPRCQRMPRGWSCSKDAGHTGPCPGSPTGFNRIVQFLRRKSSR